MKKKGKVESATFQGSCLNDIHTTEESLGINIILYDVNTVDGYFVGKLVRWSLPKHSNTVRLQRYNSHLYYVANIQALFNAIRCSTCECYFCQAIKLERHSATCLGGAKNYSSRSGDSLNGTLFDKLNFFYIPYPDKKKQSLAVLVLSSPIPG